MTNPASGSGDHPHEETPAATPAATTTVTDSESAPNNALPVSAESTQKLQATNPQVGDEDDEDSDFDELDGKQLSIQPRHHIHKATPHDADISFSQVN